MSPKSLDLCTQSAWYIAPHSSKRETAPTSELVKTTACNKVQLKRIGYPVHRPIAFRNQLTNLLKKAKESLVLCAADIGVIIFSMQGQIYELATSGHLIYSEHW